MERYFNLTRGYSLSFQDFREIRTTLNYGGLCVLPSDTGYSLAALPFLPAATQNLRLVLGISTPISLAFGSYVLIDKYVKLCAESQRIIDNLCPGPVTLVCPINDSLPESVKDKLRNSLSITDTIGIRLSDSAIERQVSVELDKPLTSAAIRYDNGDIVQKFSDAFDLVRTKAAEHQIRSPLIGVSVSKVPYPEHSTVLSADPSITSPHRVEIFREGVIPQNRINTVIDKLSASDTEDFT